MPFLLYGEEGSEIFLPAIAGQTSSSADKIFQFFKICNAIFFKMFYTVNHRELLSFVRALVSTYTLSQKRVPCLFFPNKILHYHAIFRFWIICCHFAIIYHFNICTSLNRLHHPRIVHFPNSATPQPFQTSPFPPDTSIRHMSINVNHCTVLLIFHDTLRHLRLHICLKASAVEYVTYGMEI